MRAPGGIECACVELLQGAECLCKVLCCPVWEWDAGETYRRVHVSGYYGGKMKGQAQKYWGWGVDIGRDVHSKSWGECVRTIVGM